MKVEWGHGSGYNLGRVGDSGVRIERFSTGDGEAKRWRFLLADERKTYMHVDDREFHTVKELEDAAMQWLVDAGRLVWTH